MKKSIKAILILLVLLSHGYLYGQIKGRLAIGPKAGYNFSKVNLDNATTVEGLALGLTAEYWLNSYSALSLDVLHSQEGYEVSTATVDFSYLQLPILYNTVFGSVNDLFQPKLGLGFSPGLLLKAEINGVDFKAQHKSAVLNLVGGLGSIVNLNKRFWLNTEIRGIAGITGNELNGTSSDPVKNRTLQVILSMVYVL
ncbi:MAG: outer membrane beta-barrel protein [Saprospiraceae bacterium]|nr:outer membrane beta-barrel protein [Saprospiraceae bacterium]